MQRNKWGWLVPFEPTGDRDRTGGWRSIGSAWLLVLLVLAALVGVSAVANRYAGLRQPDRPLAHVVVPHHDPTLDPRRSVGMPPT